MVYKYIIKCPKCRLENKDYSKYTPNQLKGRNLIYSCKSCKTLIYTEFGDMDMVPCVEKEKQAVLV